MWQVVVSYILDALFLMTSANGRLSSLAVGHLVQPEYPASGLEALRLVSANLRVAVVSLQVQSCRVYARSGAG